MRVFTSWKEAQKAYGWVGSEPLAIAARKQFAAGETAVYISKGMATGRVHVEPEHVTTELPSAFTRIPPEMHRVVEAAERLQQVWDGSRVGLTAAISDVADAVRALPRFTK